MNILVFFSYIIWFFLTTYFPRQLKVHRRFVGFLTGAISLIFLLQYNSHFVSATIYTLIFAVLSNFFSRKLVKNPFFPLLFFTLLFTLARKTGASFVGLSYLLLAISMDVQYLNLNWKRYLIAFIRVSSFPKAFMGPISNFRGHHRITVSSSFAARLFLVGIFKAFVVTTFLSKYFPEDYAMKYFSNHWTSNSVILFFLSGLWNYFNLFFQFSGFSDLVRSIYLFSGRNCPENFNRPYFSLSLKDFWNSWHMSLGAFIRKHIYFPLGGNQRGSVRTILNLILAMTLCGAWHGFQWNYLLWGFMQGLGIAFERVLKLDQRITFVPLRWFMTQMFVTMSWGLFFIKY